MMRPLIVLGVTSQPCCMRDARVNHMLLWKLNRTSSSSSSPIPPPTPTPPSPPSPPSLRLRDNFRLLPLRMLPMRGVPEPLAVFRMEVMFGMSTIDFFLSFIIASDDDLQIFPTLPLLRKILDLFRLRPSYVMPPPSVRYAPLVTEHVTLHSKS